MANPFGGNDEALSKNTNHTNQANLLYAVIPRTTSKIREVITGTNYTGVPTGTYDADGYWTPNSTTPYSNYLTISAFPIDSPLTLILLYKRVAVASTAFLYPGLWRNGSSTINASVRLNKDFAMLEPWFKDHLSTVALGVNVELVSSTGPYGICIKNDGTDQSGFVRIAGVNEHTYSSTVSLSSSSSSDLDQLYVETANGWPLQAIFVYSAALLDADINAIIDSPGSVLSYDTGSTFIPRRTLLGVG